MVPVQLRIKHLQFWTSDPLDQEPIEFTYFSATSHPTAFLVKAPFNPPEAESSPILALRKSSLPRYAALLPCFYLFHLLWNTGLESANCASVTGKYDGIVPSGISIFDMHPLMSFLATLCTDLLRYLRRWSWRRCDPVPVLGRLTPETGEVVDNHAYRTNRMGTSPPLLLPSTHNAPFFLGTMLILHLSIGFRLARTKCFRSLRFSSCFD